jgi:hypothetical protein
MMIGRRFFLVAIQLAFLIPAHSPQAAEGWSWDGVWTGSLGNVSPISVTIAKNTIADYEFRGAPVKVIDNKVAATTVSFGDRDHYQMTLTQMSDTTALARYHGRLGYSTAVLKKQ